MSVLLAFHGSRRRLTRLATIMATLTIHFPDDTSLPAGIEADQELLRYTIAAVLYRRGVLSGRQARELTGDSRRRFEEKMSAYGFPIMPGRPEDVAAERNA